MSDAWTTDEHRAAVDAYLEMLHAQEAGKPYSKAEIRRRLRQGPLSSRSDPSIEFRFRNISAVLYHEGKQAVEGYLPLDHLGPAAYAAIIGLLQERGLISPDDYAPTADPAELDARTRRLRRRGPTLFEPEGQTVVQRVEARTTVFVRDPEVRAFVLSAANGRCEWCQADAPFSDASGQPFLELHHVVPLSEGGPD